MATAVGLAFVLVLAGVMLWTVIDGIVDEGRHVREMARIRDESRQILARISGN